MKIRFTYLRRLLVLALLTSAWVSSLAVVTNFPFVENFETNSTTVADWTQIYGDGMMSWTFTTGAVGGAINTAYEGTRNAKFISSNGYGYLTRLISPVLDLSDVSSPKLSFYLAQESWQGEQNTTKVYYRTSESASWILLGEYDYSIDVWTKFEHALPNPTATYQISFVGINNYGRANVIDLVKVYESRVSTFPFIESFETNSTTLNAWSQISEGAEDLWTFDTGAGQGNITTAFDGTRNARFISAYTSPRAKLVSPTLDLSGIILPQLSFYLGQEKFDQDSQKNSTDVYYRTSPTSDWVLLAEYSNEISTWTNFVLDLPNPTATYQIAFEGIPNDGCPNVIDLVKVYETPPMVITTFPFIETFETSSTTLNDWRQIYEVGNEAWTFGEGITDVYGSIKTAYEGNRNARFIISNQFDYRTKLVSPQLDLIDIHEPKLSFYLGQEEWGNKQNTTAVYYRTSESSAWQLLGEYTNNINNWKLCVLDLPNPSKTYQIAFDGTNNGGHANVIDLVGVYESATPPQVVTAFPFIETFETSSATLKDWRQIHEVGTANWTFEAGSNGGGIWSAHEGERNARFIGNSDIGYKTKLVSPPLDLSGISSPKLSFYLGQPLMGDSDQNTTKVFYRKSATSPWVEVDNYTEDLYNWSLCEFDLPEPTATYQIAFEGTNNWGYANVIDLVKVYGTSTGINNSEATDDVQIYVSGGVLHFVTAFKEPTLVKVYNLMGNLLLQGKTDSTIDVSTLSNGIYVVNIMQNNGIVVSRKVSIQK